MRDLRINITTITIIIHFYLLLFTIIIHYQDDEFEDFEGITWEDVNDKSTKAASSQLWKDDWDDDVHDDFMDQLREVVKKQELNTKAASSMDTSDNAGAAAGGKSK